MLVSWQVQCWLQALFLFLLYILLQISFYLNKRMSNEQYPINVTIVKYVSGLGVPGIMPPKLASTLEITGHPEGGAAKAVKHTFDGQNPEGSKEEKDLSADDVKQVFSLVDQLKSLPVRKAQSGPDVFGHNATVVVRQGPQVLWGYNPGSGCVVNPADQEQEFAINSDHKVQFASLVDGIMDACY